MFTQNQDTQQLCLDIYSIYYTVCSVASQRQFLRPYQRTLLGRCTASSHLIPARWKLLQVVLLEVWRRSEKKTKNVLRYFQVNMEVMWEDMVRHQTKRAPEIMYTQYKRHWNKRFAKRCKKQSSTYILAFHLHGFQFWCRPSNQCSGCIKSFSKQNTDLIYNIVFIQY